MAGRDEKGVGPPAPLLIQSDGKGFLFSAGRGGVDAVLVSVAPLDGAIPGSKHTHYLSRRPLTENREEIMTVQTAELRAKYQTDDGDLVRQILTAIRGVRYGQVQIIIQDSRVVQIDKTEKLRLA
jgi:hypothetical protein